MLKNKVKTRFKCCSLALILAFSAPIAVKAATKTDTITFGNLTATCKLEPKWSLTSYDKAKARTEFGGTNHTGYKVTAYVEAEDKSHKIGARSRVDSGLQWAEVNLSRKGVWRFNSSHSIANSNNVYKPLSLSQLTDW